VIVAMQPELLLSDQCPDCNTISVAATLAELDGLRSNGPKLLESHSH
jgi:hypothetical protein